MRKIIITGLGALGSHAMLFLRDLTFERAGSGPFELVGIDCDRVEQKNTLAQFHAKSTVGRNKAASLQQSLFFLFRVRVEAIPHRLTRDNVRVLLEEAALVIDCLDNAASRRLVQACVRELRIPCLHGALAAGGTIGRVVWDDKFRIDDEGGAVATCHDGEHLPFIALVSAYIARAAQEFSRSGEQLSFQVFSKSAAMAL